MFTVLLTLGCLEKSSSDNEHGTRRWTTLGSLVFRAAEDRKWRVGRKTSEPSSVVVCDIFILKWNMNITFSKILQDFTVHCLNIYLLYNLFV